MWKWGDRRVQTLSQRRKREKEHSWHTYTDSYRWGYKSSLPLRSTNFAKKSTSYWVKGRRAYARLFLRENPRLFGQRLSGPPYLLYCKLPLVNPVIAYVYRWLLCLTHKVDIRKFLVLRITPSPVPCGLGVSLKCAMPDNCACIRSSLPSISQSDFFTRPPMPIKQEGEVEFQTFFLEYTHYLKMDVTLGHMRIAAPLG